MSTYTAPLKDMQFAIAEFAGLDSVAALPGCGDVNAELVEAILTEAGKFAQCVLDPLNRSGDKQGAQWRDGVVSAPDGFKDAYAQFVGAGWNGLGASTAYGGQGLPHIVAMPLQEMWNSANMAFCLCPMLTTGVQEALMHHGSPVLLDAYMSKLVSGEWTGTMNLTEPQAGSDLSAVRTRAVPEGDHYRIHGTKIFITWGEHDMTSNIVHLLLARLPDAPEGVKGISLFVVPKFMVNADGSPGARNDIRCVSIEHKMGIHGSPTCVLAYGDGPGAVGYLVGEPNRGLEYMFTMMNHARLGVGMEGIAIAERAYQHALEYAKTRVQGRAIGQHSGDRVTIIHHPDVRRMLMTMRAYTEGCRAMASVAAAAYDAAHHHPDADARQQNLAVYEFMVPLVKGFSTEMSLEVTSLGVQVHGGMGFIEETGAAQYYRDAKILTIYEGTTAIQANDLVGRKTARDGGQTPKALAAQMEKTEAELLKIGSDDAKAISYRLAAARSALLDVVNFIVEAASSNPNAAYAGSVPYLMLAGNVISGWQLARSFVAAHQALANGDSDTAFLQAKQVTARFYADHILSKAPSVRDSIVQGADSVTAMALEAF